MNFCVDKAEDEVEEHKNKMKGCNVFVSPVLIINIILQRGFSICKEIIMNKSPKDKI